MSRSLDFPDALPRSVAFEFSDDGEASLVSVSTFDPCDLDSIEDHIIEELQAGRPTKPIVQKLLAEELRAAQCEGARLVLAHLIGPRLASVRNVRLNAVALAFACGADFGLGRHGPSIAAKLGCSKQNFFAAVKQARRRLKLRRPLGRNKLKRSQQARLGRL